MAVHASIPVKKHQTNGRMQEAILLSQLTTSRRLISGYSPWRTSTFSRELNA